MGWKSPKRAWICDTASNGAATPDTITLPNGSICTVQTSSNGLLPGAEQVNSASAGQDLYYEISILNSGAQTFNSLQLVDNSLVNFGGGLEPNAPAMEDGTEWEDANGNIYTWSNGQMIIGVEDYHGRGNGPCPTPDDAGTPDDETYQCVTAYRGFDNGPFGPDDPATDADESYLFSTEEVFERPDPGLVDIPVITYPHSFVLPDDDIDDNEAYTNRVQVVATPYDPQDLDLLPIANTDTLTLQLRTSSLEATAIACAETDGDLGTFDDAPCIGVVEPGGDVWYEVHHSQLLTHRT